jgi:2-polyprenyl-3-methyl-5-hydroxy-6-metoxy-1,4-benzoquinol methylase
MSRIISNQKIGPRILVALASYGTSNDRYLLQVIEEYRAMAFDVDIVVLSNIEKRFDQGIEVLVGLPNPNPWSLPFAHKKLFAERLNRYDLFIYSEDDILITETNLRAFLDVTATLREDEVAGFFRIERGSDGGVNYPDVHAYFHWDPESVRSRGKYTLAKFTNEHAACYVLTRNQLEKAIVSGGFVVKPHEGKYDLLCSAATDPYTQCGFTKLIPISHLDNFSVHHLSDKYLGRVGVDGLEMRAQIDALLRGVENKSASKSLIHTETKLWRCTYSKDFYEPISSEVLSAIPPKARSVLSIGSGWGAIERELAERGLRVVAIPLDHVICSRAAGSGVEIVYGDFRTARAKLGTERFDCVLFLNVLHLIRDPVEVLSLFRDVLLPESTVIIQIPNMQSGPSIWRRLRNAERFRNLGDFELTGAHLTSIAKIHHWCRDAELTLQKTIPISDPRTQHVYPYMPGLLRPYVASEIIILATPQ